ncbi:hypothetical protein [Zooshikella sp. RANM57]|uniref:hypothetical protein n=1 Tax=Zooshikella sp. RANM57 TaxID=3425863 RepID=UPI003D6EDF37
MRINKRTLLILLLVVSFTVVFFKWAERGLAYSEYERKSPNGKFIVAIYTPWTIVEPNDIFAKLYDNETGKLIAESKRVFPERLYWDIGGDDEVYIGVEKIFDLKDYDTEYKSFIK